VEEKFTDILFNGLMTDRGAPDVVVAADATDAEAGSTSWESFLLAATRLINEQGYRGASVDAIARKLNRTKGSFYHHVEGKGDLLAACFNRTLGVLRDAQKDAVASQRSGLDRARAATIALVRRQQTEAGPLLRSSALMSAEDDKREAMFRDLAGVVMHFCSMMTDGIVDGSVRACDARVAAEMIMVTVNSAAQIRNWTKDPTPEFAAEVYARPVFAGLYA
jgi:AcrR family transcriptional regulator